MHNVSTQGCKIHSHDKVFPVESSSSQNKENKYNRCKLFRVSSVQCNDVTEEQLEQKVDAVMVMCVLVL